jgi:hypothetical protein
MPKSANQNRKKISPYHKKVNDKFDKENMRLRIDDDLHSARLQRLTERKSGPGRPKDPLIEEAKQKVIEKSALEFEQEMLEQSIKFL